MRVTFVIHAMGAGGAERVMATMANYWADASHQITILTLEDAQSGSFYRLHRAVALRQLGVATASRGTSQALAANFRRLRVLRNAIVESKPDVVIAFVDIANITTLLAAVGTRIPVIVEEHTDPAVREIGRPWRMLRGITYRSAARVIVLSDTARSFFPKSIQGRTEVIPNPIVITPGIRTDHAERRKRLVALGRLAPEKGFSRLIDAFAAVADRHPDWDLAIYGQGPLREALERQLEGLPCRHRISLPGVTDRPNDVVRDADLFALTSLREGFPMALGEAMACGTPVVAIDCPSGPRQLIRHGIDGLLIPDAGLEPFINALDVLMGDEHLRLRLARNGPDVLQRFGLERVMTRWEALIAEVAPQARKAPVSRLADGPHRKAA